MSQSTTQLLSSYSSTRIFFWDRFCTSLSWYSYNSFRRDFYCLKCSSMAIFYSSNSFTIRNISSSYFLIRLSHLPDVFRIYCISLSLFLVNYSISYNWLSFNRSFSCIERTSTTLFYRSCNKKTFFSVAANLSFYSNLHLDSNSNNCYSSFSMQYNNSRISSVLESASSCSYFTLLASSLLPTRMVSKQISAFLRLVAVSPSSTLFLSYSRFSSALYSSSKRFFLRI
jgi:hypothetical protein